MNYKLLKILRQHFNPRTPKPGSGKHVNGHQTPKDARAKLKAYRKAQRVARKQARRQKAKRKHRR